MQWHGPKPDHRARQASDPLYLDLSDPAHLDLVRRIYLRRFAHLVEARGLDHEDVLATVHEGLLRKAASEGSAWDPSRGSLSTWLFVAVRGLVLHACAKERTASWRVRLGEGEDVALSAPTHSDNVGTDAGETLAEFYDEVYHPHQARLFGPVPAEQVEAEIPIPALKRRHRSHAPALQQMALF